MTTSPVIKSSISRTMTFDEAMKCVKDGEKITRLEWEPGYCGLLTKGYLMLQKPDGKLYQWIVNDGDILAEDWRVVE